MSPEEKAIYDCIQEVEKLGADTRLTDCVVKLSQAKDHLSDFIDNLEPVEDHKVSASLTNLTKEKRAAIFTAIQTAASAWDENKSSQHNTDKLTEIAEALIDQLYPSPVEPKEESFMDRLLKERDELSTKIDKLSAFLGKTDLVKTVGMVQAEWLFDQQRVMREYLGILDKRIANLEPQQGI